MSPIKPIPPIPKEFRVVILFYLVFLSLLIIFQNRAGGELATPAFSMDGQGGRHEQSLYRLQDWQLEMERRMTALLEKEDIEVEETTWQLQERSGPKPMQWSITEFRLHWDPKRPMKDLADFQKKLEETVDDLGGTRISADVSKLNGMTYYRLNYGIHWGNKLFITHRLYLLKPEQYPNDLKKLGLALKHRTQRVTPLPKMDALGMIPKDQVVPPNQPVAKVKPSPQANEETKGAIKEATTELKKANPLTKLVVPPQQQKARIAIIIDDFGFVKEPAEAYFRIHAPLTIAVLPGGQHSKEHALRATQAGFEVLLHQPLEPIHMDRNNPGPGFISGKDSDERIRAEFQANLAEVPGAVGFNNHMGSAGTQDKHLMSILMSEAKRDGLFFIDSRSIGNSVGEETARKAGVLHAGRRVFIDNEFGGIRQQLENLKAVALRNGSAIGIAHARPGVAKALEDFLPEFTRAGIKIVHVSELVHQ